MFEEEGIQERLVKMSEFDPQYVTGCSLSSPAGIIQAGGLKRDMVSSKVITASGKEDCLVAIHDFDKQLILFIITLIFSSVMAVCSDRHENHTESSGGVLL
jgi:hypothetical protein